MSQTKTTIQTEFVIAGDKFDLHEVTRRLEIEPDESWAKGERMVMGDQSRLHRSTMWCLKTNEQELLNVKDQIDQLFPRIEAKKTELLLLRQEFDIVYRLGIIAYIKEYQTPGIWFEARVLRFLGEIEASIDIDLYDLSDDTNDESELVGDDKTS